MKEFVLLTTKTQRHRAKAPCFNLCVSVPLWLERFFHTCSLLVCLVFLLVPHSRLHGQSRQAEIQAHLTRAAEAYAAGRWKLAADEYSEVTRLDPSNAQVLARLGAVYQKLGMLKEAQTSLNKALQLEPALPDAGVVLAFVDIGLGQYQDALPLLEKALADPRDDLPVRLAGGERLVDLDFMLQHQDKALEAVEQLRKLAPDDPNVLYTASRAYSAMWKTVVERMYAKAPGSYRTHQVLAEAAAAKGDFAEAAKEYRLVTKMAPTLPGIHYELGRMIFESTPTSQGMEQALAEFQEELSIDPQDGPTNSQMGEIYLKMHRLNDAELYFSKAIQMPAPDTDARIGLGRVFLEEKRYEEARGQFEAATRSAPRNPTAYYELMIACRALGRTTEAKTALNNFERLRTQAVEQQASTLKELEAPLVDSPR